MSNFVIKATTRSDLGKGASRRLRREQGLVPAIVFGGTAEPKSLSLSHKDLLKMTESESFFSSILTLDVDGTEEKVVLKDLQRHPAKPAVLHADFLRAVPGQAIKVQVPLHFTNQNKSAAIKLGAKANVLVNTVMIQCTPETLPEFLAIDMANVAVDQTIHLSDIVLPEGVKITALALGEDYDQAVVTLARKRSK